MKEIFAALYEGWFNLYNADYHLIFDNLLENGGYIKLGLSLILIPLVLWFLFYFLWKYPYGTYRSWLLWLLVVVVIVFSVTMSIARIEIFSSSNSSLIDALAFPGTGYETYASSLPGEYAKINLILALVVSLIYSLIMKQFSRIQAHLPI